MSAKKMVSPCQYPRKNPGGSKPPGAGCVAHDASSQQVKIQHLGGLQFPSLNCGDHAPQLSSIRGKVLVNAVTRKVKLANPHLR
jgi:hypothetical protein